MQAQESDCGVTSRPKPGQISRESFAHLNSDQKLDVIMDYIAKVHDQLQGVDLKSVQTTLQSQENDIADMQKKIENLAVRTSILEAKDRKKDILIKELQGKVTDLTVRSMEDNIVFHRIPEKNNESLSDLDRTIADFMRDDMKIPSEVVDQMDYFKMHRYGAKGDHPRPVVMKVSPYTKNRIFHYARNIDKNKYGISNQYPSEIQEKRLELKHVQKYSQDPTIKKCTRHKAGLG